MTTTPHPGVDGPSNVDLRRHWMGVLAKAGVGDLEGLWSGLGADTKYTLLRGPETGLVMVRARAGGTSQRYNQGEMTVTRCSVTLAGGATGHAYVAGRSHRHAELAAVLDALLQDPDRHERLYDAVIDPLAKAQLRRRQEQAKKTAATKVEFFTLVRGED